MKNKTPQEDILTQERQRLLEFQLNYLRKELLYLTHERYRMTYSVSGQIYRFLRPIESRIASFVGLDVKESGGNPSNPQGLQLDYSLRGLDPRAPQVLVFGEQTTTKRIAASLMVFCFGVSSINFELPQQIKSKIRKGGQCIIYVLHGERMSVK